MGTNETIPKWIITLNEFIDKENGSLQAKSLIACRERLVKNHCLHGNHFATNGNLQRETGELGLGSKRVQQVAFLCWGACQR